MPKRSVSSLFQMHGTELRAFLTRKLHDRETAAELTQETFVRFIAQGSAGAAAIGNERAYLFRVALNLVIDHKRRRREPAAEAPSADDLAEIVDPRPNPEHTYASKEQLALIDDALAAMPTRTREIFILKRVHGFSYQEIAQRLGVSESAVQKHLASGLKGVMQHLRSLDQAET